MTNAIEKSGVASFVTLSNSSLRKIEKCIKIEKKINTINVRKVCRVHTKCAREKFLQKRRLIRDFKAQCFQKCAFPYFLRV